MAQKSGFVWHESRGSYAIKVCDSSFFVQKGMGFYVIRPLILQHVLGAFLLIWRVGVVKMAVK